MKQFFLVAAIAAMFSILLGISSCSTDKCQNVTCQNGGTCNNGNCNCPPGYSGANCQTAANDQFIGTFVGQINCGGGASAASQPITAGLNGSPFSILLLSPPDNLNATVSGNSLTIPYQTFADGNTFSGSGTINGNSLSITLILTSSGTTTTCYFTGTN